MTAMILYKKNGAYLRVLNVMDAKTSAYVSDATVTATLRTYSSASGLGTSAPSAEIDDLALTPIVGTDGGYEAAIASTFDAPRGTGYRCVIDIVKSGIEPAHFEIPVEVKTRTSS